MSVKSSLNHVLLWDNLKGNAKRNSFEFRRITPVNKKQKYCNKYFVTWMYSWDLEEGPSTGRSPCVRVAVVDRNPEH